MLLTLRLPQPNFLGIVVSAVTLLAMSGEPLAGDRKTAFAINVLHHVAFHEFAHALVHEFELPVLGNEEVMADAFSTIMVVEHFRDSAPSVIMDRAQSWLIEAAEVHPTDYDLAGEHELDERRAYRASCLIFGADPQAFGDIASWNGLSEHDAAECSDIAPQIITSWDSVLAPHRLSGGRRSSNIEVQYGDARHTDTVIASHVLENVADVMRGFSWPRPIVLHYDSCGREAAFWSSQKRKVQICDEYFDRFIRQGDLASGR